MKPSWFARLLCFALGHQPSDRSWPDPETGLEQLAFSRRMGICLRCGTITRPDGDGV